MYTCLIVRVLLVGCRAGNCISLTKFSQAGQGDNNLQLQFPNLKFDWGLLFCIIHLYLYLLNQLGTGGHTQKFEVLTHSLGA